MTKALGYLFLSINLQISARFVSPLLIRRSLNS